MNKLSKKIHSKFVSGQINGAIFEYMNKIAHEMPNLDVASDEHFDNLKELKINNINECQVYFELFKKISQYNMLKKNSKDTLGKLYKFAFLNKNNYNLTNDHNIVKLQLDFINKNKELVKNSYPNNYGIDDLPIKPPYNIEKWGKALKYIYNISNTNNLPFDEAFNRVVQSWDPEEKEHFSWWVKYYQQDAGKYNVKTAQFFSNKLIREPAYTNQVEDDFDFEAKPDPNVEKEKRLNEVRRKLYGRLRSVEELVEKFRDVLPRDISSDIRKDVYELKEKIFGLELKASLVDSITRTSNRIMKKGFIEGAQELKKIAQEVADNKLPEVAPPNNMDGQQDATESTEQAVKPKIEVGSDNIKIPDIANATFEDAVRALEQVNTIISERSVVRALAGVDLILGNLGVASFFPELSQAMSKLLEAFEYSNTRVGSVLSQMRGGNPAEKFNAESTTPEGAEETVETNEEFNKPTTNVKQGPPTATNTAPQPAASQPNKAPTTPPTTK